MDTGRQAASATRPIEYRNIGTGPTNDTVRPRSIGRLAGSRLKSDPNESDEGLCLVTDAVRSKLSSAISGVSAAG
ncbi:MAG: hypothetical protein JXQ75_01245 [Phycisphaerae bacterium]|nr:hypothetical protein [Phycisphaerae bacterium]